MEHKCGPAPERGRKLAGTIDASLFKPADGVKKYPQVTTTRSDWSVVRIDPRFSCTIGSS